MCEEPSSGTREDDAPRSTLEQLLPHDVLESFELKAHGGLGKPHSAGRSSERAGLRYGHKRSQESKVELFAHYISPA